MSENFPAVAGARTAGFTPGARIAGYVLEEQIGAGGMAVVFRARDERLQRRVALKILSPALAPDDAFRQRFIRESQAAAAVDDPHIIPVFGAGEAEDAPFGGAQFKGALFIAMRYVPGGDGAQLAVAVAPEPARPRDSHRRLRGGGGTQRRDHCAPDELGHWIGRDREEAQHPGQETPAAPGHAHADLYV